MKKYVVMIDYKSATGKMFGWEQIEAKNLVEAMDKADEIWNDEVYLMAICEKSSKTVREAGFKVTEFTTVLFRRSFGWHTEKQSEVRTTVKQYVGCGNTSYCFA